MAQDGSEVGNDIFKLPNGTGQLTQSHDTLLSSTFCKDIFKARTHTPLKLGENDMMQGYVTCISRVLSRFRRPYICQAGPTTSMLRLWKWRLREGVMLAAIAGNTWCYLFYILPMAAHLRTKSPASPSTQVFSLSPSLTWSQVSRSMTSSVARSSCISSPGTSSIWEGSKGVKEEASAPLVPRMSLKRYSAFRGPSPAPGHQTFSRL